MKKILVVDDTAEIRDVLRGLLETNYTVFLAKNGEQAIKLAKKRKPDLVLLDIIMPEMNGYKVCQLLKADEQTRDIPVIFVTAKGDIEDEQMGFGLGAVDYITKPIKPFVLLARVNNHLELKEKKDVLEEKLRIEKELSKIKDDIERITRHDLKSPLNLIMYLSKSIKKAGDNLTDNQIDQLDKIYHAGNRLSNVINMSLDLYKMEQGIYRLSATPIDIKAILDDIVQDNHSLIKRKHVTMGIYINDKPATEGYIFKISGEKQLFYSMLANLIKNAIEASPQNETIAIQLLYSNNLTIAINNQGTVPKGIQDTFFEKYVTSGKTDGTGLGTYSARLIAETMGGCITMHSSEEDGTTITITFPQ